MRPSALGRAAIGLAVLVVAGAAGGDDHEKPPATDKPVPKITSVSPAYALVDQLTELTIVLHGTNLQVAGKLEIAYDTDPSQGLVRCAAADAVSDTELRCTLRAAKDRHLADELPIGEGVHFAASWRGTDNKLVVTEPSAGTFTARRPILARSMCVVHREHSDVQVRLRAPGIASGASVWFDKDSNDKTKFPCLTPQVFGTEDIVCYLPETSMGDLNMPLRVQILRAGEHATAAKTNTTSLHADLVGGCGPLAPE